MKWSEGLLDDCGTMRFCDQIVTIAGPNTVQLVQIGVNKKEI